MRSILSIPHRTAHGMCPVNGIRDLIHWQTGKDWTNEFLFGLGQGGGFAYLRINVAEPPRQVYWGTASPRQHRYLAELLGAEYSETENRSFTFTCTKAREALESGMPPVIGPLDMYHLPFYDDLYHQRHIPIHYLLLVGLDTQVAYVYDTDHTEVQALPLDELKLAWDVNVPGMGKRNRLVTLRMPEMLAPDKDLICQSIRDECKLMLEPPVSMLGIPAMQKLARELAAWPEVLGEEAAKRCLQQVREYLSSPPDVLGCHLTAGRDIYITFLRQAGEMAGLDFQQAIDHFCKAMQLIPLIAEAIQYGDLHEAASGFEQVAGREKQAFTCLSVVIEPNAIL
jgi:hypothetical protein